LQGQVIGLRPGSWLPRCMTNAPERPAAAGDRLTGTVGEESSSWGFGSGLEQYEEMSSSYCPISFLLNRHPSTTNPPFLPGQSMQLPSPVQGVHRGPLRRVILPSFISYNLLHLVQRVPNGLFSTTHLNPQL